MKKLVSVLAIISMAGLMFGQAPAAKTTTAAPAKTEKKAPVKKATKATADTTKKAANKTKVVKK